VWMALAHRVALKGQARGLGEAMAAVVVQREGTRVQLVAVAADARWHMETMPRKGVGNPMGHCVLRAISMVAQKLVRYEHRLKGEELATPALVFDALQESGRIPVPRAGNVPDTRAVRAVLDEHPALADGESGVWRAHAADGRADVGGPRTRASGTGGVQRRAGIGPVLAARAQLELAGVGMGVGRLCTGASEHPAVDARVGKGGGEESRGGERGGE